MSKQIRQIDSTATQDSHSIANSTYNKQAGAQKNAEVGRRLIPLYTGAAYTTDATTIKSIPAGKNLAVFNKDTTLHAITFGESAAQAALAAGVTDGTGHVGLPCPGGEWSYFAAWTSTFVISDSAQLCVFLIDDDSFAQNVPAR